MNRLSTNVQLLSLIIVSIIVISVVNIWTLPYFVGGVIHEQSHYISISWHMWQSHQWLLMRDDIGVYLNKPPLLFWLINVGWHLFGVHNWVLRAIPGLFAIGNSILLLQLFKQLWPEHKQHAWIAPLILLGSWYYLHYIPLLMQDLILMFFCILSLNGILLAIKRPLFGWLLFTMASSLGVLIKGPIIFVYTLPAAMTAPLWLKQTNFSTSRWFINLLTSLIASAGLVSIWLVPYLIKLNSIDLLPKLMTRIFDLKHVYESGSWWTYFVQMPLDLLPWTLWPVFYTSFYYYFKSSKQNSSAKFTWVCFMLIFLVLNLISVRASRYLMPAYIYFSLFSAYCLIEYTNQSFKQSINNNYVYMISAIIGAALVICSPFAHHLLHKSSDFHWFSFMIPGLVLIIMSVVFLKQQNKNLYSAIIKQSVFIIVALLVYTLFITRVTMQNHHLTTLTQCVDNLANQGRPIAYQTDYHGYLYHVGQPMMPTGPTLYNYHQYHHWRKKHPNGILVAKANRNQTISHALCDVNFNNRTKIVAYPIVAPQN